MPYLRNNSLQNGRNKVNFYFYLIFLNLKVIKIKEHRESKSILKVEHADKNTRVL